MKPTRIDISAKIQNGYYDRGRDIETALVYNALKKCLEAHGKGELFQHIKSIKITDASIVITTKKPIILSELIPLKGEFRELIATLISSRKTLRFQ